MKLAQNRAAHLPQASLEFRLLGVMGASVIVAHAAFLEVRAVIHERPMPRAGVLPLRGLSHDRRQSGIGNFIKARP